jgi:uncharacterized membrane protein YoaK (UPF0700 family)
MYSQARQDPGMPRLASNSRMRPRLPAGLADGLPLLLLTVVSACMDAISYLGLGHVFPANMTGNTVLLGIGLATGDHTGALRSATALLAYLVGAATVGASLPQQVSRRAMLTVLAAEIAALAVLCGWWLAATSHAPTGGTRYGLIALAGLTMGWQSGLTYELKAPVSTTYITGTWTAVSATAGQWLRGRQPHEPHAGAREQALRVVVVAAYFATAYLAAFVYTRAFGAATAIALGVLVVVAVMTAQMKAWGREPA